MSQSDYIKYKRTQTMLKEQMKMNKILNSQDYTNHETYSIETTVSNTKIRPSRLILPNTISVMEMEKRVTSCPTFILCKNTNTRPNRVLNSFKPPAATFKSSNTTGKQLGLHGKEPIENSTKCTFQKNNYVQRTCTCYKLPKICKCRTKICKEQTILE